LSGNDHLLTFGQILKETGQSNATLTRGLKSLQKEGKILHRGQYYCRREFEEDLELKLQESRKDLQAASSAHTNNIVAGLLCLISNQFLEGGEELKPLSQYAQRALEHLKSGYEPIFAKCIEMFKVEKRKQKLVTNLEKHLTEKIRSDEDRNLLSDKKPEWASGIAAYLLSIGSYQDTKAPQEFFSRNMENVKLMVEGFVSYQAIGDSAKHEVKVRGFLVADNLTEGKAILLSQAIKDALLETITSEAYLSSHEDFALSQRSFQELQKEFENNIQKLIRKIAIDRVDVLKGICEVCYEQGFTLNEMIEIGEVYQIVFGHIPQIFY
jgi:hypothetical protein